LHYSATEPGGNGRYSGMTRKSPQYLDFLLHTYQLFANVLMSNEFRSRCSDSRAGFSGGNNFEQGTDAVGITITKAFRAAATGCAAVAAAALLTATLANAQGFARDTPSQQGRDQGQYIPNIVLTPDGCEVWAADDGAEGYASNRLTRKGTPICHDVTPCGRVNTDQFFATDSYRIHANGRARLQEFFRGSSAFAYTIVGHTDSRASHEYNLRLSYNRAIAVAKVAESVGAKIADVRGMGETAPVAPNSSVEGMARNRRVEILCFQ